MNKTSYLQFKSELQKIDKTFFSFDDLKKFYQNEKGSLSVLLSNWKKNKWIYHLVRGFYSWDLARVDYLHLASIFDNTSYLSFEYALYYYNLIDQVPSLITLTTKKRTRLVTAGNYTFEYTHLKDDLFFDISLKNKIYIATPEKSLADLIYLVSRGKRTVELDNLEKDKINQKKLKSILKNFPSYVLRRAEELEIV